MRRSAVTQKQIAEQLGLAQSTVHAALSDSPEVAAATRRRVRELAEQLGYRPNRLARALRTGRTGMCAIFVPGVDQAYYAQIVHHAQGLLAAAGYEVVVGTTRSFAPRGSDSFALPVWPVDGVLAAADPPEANGETQQHRRQAPLVLVGNVESPHFDSVLMDLYPPAVEAVQHLLATCGPRVAYLVNSATLETGDARTAAYHRTMAEAGAETHAMVAPAQNRDVARATVCDYLGRREPPRGIFCVNDEMAIGAYRGLRDLGLRIPDDVALVGCDGILDTEYLDPPLSTLVQPIEEMCRRGWELLQRRMADPSLPRQSDRVVPRLVVRGSSAAQGPGQGGESLSRQRPAVFRSVGSAAEPTTATGG